MLAATDSPLPNALTTNANTNASQRWGSGFLIVCRLLDRTYRKVVFELRPNKPIR